MFTHLSITEPGRPNRTVVVNGTMTIGRDPQNDIVLSASSVSRWHVMLFHDADGLLLVDLESANGTLVNSLVIQPEEPMRLANGDVIQLGEVVVLCAALPKRSIAIESTNDPLAYHTFMAQSNFVAKPVGGPA